MLLVCRGKVINYEIYKQFDMLFIYCVHNDIEEQKSSLYLKFHLVCKYIRKVFDQSFMNYQQPVSYPSTWIGPMMWVCVLINQLYFLF